MHLIKSKKLLKEASKSQTKLLTWLMKQKMTLEKTHLSKKVHDEASKVLSQTTAQLDQVRTTVTKHTADIAHIEALLEDCESADEVHLCVSAGGDLLQFLLASHCPTQGHHNVMPARIVGGRLLLKHTDETASSEAAGHCRI